MISGAGGGMRRAAAVRGFTLLELLVVLAIIAVSVATVSLALRDGSATALERDAVRLASLLEVARSESRVSGSAVRWLPGAGDNAPDNTSNSEPAKLVAFRFQGLPPGLQAPTHWLDPRVVAEVVGRPAVVLGPEAILPPQRVLLRLEDQQIEVASDGLSPFAIASGAGTAPRQ
jgi:general secretion pathway protein H